MGKCYAFYKITGEHNNNIAPLYIFVLWKKLFAAVPLYSSLRRFPNNFGRSLQIAAPRMLREIDQSTQRFYVGWFHVGCEGIGDQLDAVTQNVWFRCALCAAISGEISILIQTGAES